MGFKPFLYRLEVTQYFSKGVSSCCFGILFAISYIPNALGLDDLGSRAKDGNSLRVP
jgi:hypothetical protein